MSYIEETLTPDERVVDRTRLHWVVFVRPLVFVGSSLALLALSVAMGLEAAVAPFLDWLREGGESVEFETLTDRERYSLVLVAAALLILVLSSASWLHALIRYRTSEFAVTNRRVLLKVGFIRRDTVEIVLSKVETIKVRQGLLGRILNYGSLQVVGTGGSTDSYHRIATPIRFRRSIQQQIAEDERPRP